MATDEPLFPRHGGYRRLMSFQVAQLVFDVTVRFCDRYIDRRSRTRDQMVQAARSGVQNIAEGSVASVTSKKMELKLTNVARASLEELRLDYEDFLRQRGLALWAEDDPRRRHLVERRCGSAEEVATWVREIHDGRDGLHGQNGQDGHRKPENQAESMGSTGSMGSMKSMGPTGSMKSMKFIGSAPPTYPEIAANAAHALVGVACALLRRQLAAQAESFEKDGGFTERLYRTRFKRRDP